MFSYKACGKNVDTCFKVFTLEQGKDLNDYVRNNERTIYS